MNYSIIRALEEGVDEHLLIAGLAHGPLESGHAHSSFFRRLELS